MSPKPDVSIHRKQQIHEAALRCFGRKGYYQATMDEIAAECGLSKGSLYWYFKSKKELALSLFTTVMDQFSEAWTTIFAEEESSAAARLRASLALFGVEMEEWASFFGVMMEVWSLTPHDEDIESMTREFYRPFLEMLTALIEEGVAKKEFKTADSEASALAIMCLFDGITLAAGMNVVDFDWRQLYQAAVNLVLNGLGVGQLDGDPLDH